MSSLLVTLTITDKYFDDGGNFIDTANNYHDGETELWLGDWMAQRQNRDQIVIATKFTSYYPSQPKNIKINYAGNHVKSLRLSVDNSLQKLQTSYVDLLYVHWWEFATSIPEVMHTLHNLVTAGKVLYLGVSDTPAWVVSKANEYARQKDLTTFVAYQGLWSAMVRDFERDLLPMCENEGMAIAPWGTLGQSSFKTDQRLEETKHEGRQFVVANDKSRAVTNILNTIAKRKSTEATSIAIAYIRAKYAYVYPVVGGRTIEHLQQNVNALGVTLAEEEVDEIDTAAPFDLGFPMSFIFEFGGAQTYASRMTPEDIPFLKAAGTLDGVRKPHGPTLSGLQTKP